MHGDVAPAICIIQMIFDISGCGVNYIGKIPICFVQPKQILANALNCHQINDRLSLRTMDSPVLDRSIVHPCFKVIGVRTSRLCSFIICLSESTAYVNR